MSNNEASFNSACIFKGGSTGNYGSTVNTNYVYYSTKDNDTNTDKDADSISIVGFG